jgi:Protein of unknown function (DUF2490)
MKNLLRSPFLKIVFLTGFVLSVQMLKAQDSSTQKQIWPEIDVYYRINERIRFYAMISGTRANSEYTDGTAGIYMDYFALPWIRGRKYTDLHDTTRGYYWWFRFGYSYSNSPPGDQKKVVDIIETETNNNFRLPAEIALTSRNRFDWRFVNGVFQPIYRPRLKFIRDFKTEYLTFDTYIWAEYFFYLNDNSQNRFRLTAGTDIKVLKNMDFEIYYLYQFQHAPSVEPLNAIGLQLNFYFKSKHYKQLTESTQKKP